MGKRLSEYPVLLNLSGNEFTPLVFQGKNYITKLSTLIGLAVGTNNSFGELESQVNINKLAIQSMNDTISNLAVNSNNTMGQVTTLAQEYNSLMTKVTSDAAQIAQMLTEISNIQLEEAGEIQTSLVFDQAEW